MNATLPVDKRVSVPVKDKRSKMVAEAIERFETEIEPTLSGKGGDGSAGSCSLTSNTVKGTSNYNTNTAVKSAKLDNQTTDKLKQTPATPVNNRQMTILNYSNKGKSTPSSWASELQRITVKPSTASLNSSPITLISPVKASGANLVQLKLAQPIRLQQQLTVNGKQLVAVPNPAGSGKRLVYTIAGYDSNKTDQSTVGKLVAGKESTVSHHSPTKEGGATPSSSPRKMTSLLQQSPLKGAAEMKMEIADDSPRSVAPSGECFLVMFSCC